ncbi:MAG TPA: hypothetical protein VE075_05215 [Thermoanaerobaculia bacterium]|nr:hypothetical protein [Thermoanaerobaculia bacterium]
MREITKSLTSFSWALSLFGVQQVVNFVQRPLPAADHPAARELGTAARAGEQQLGGTFERVFKAGDQVQRSAVDLAFGLVSLEALDPSRLATLSADLLRQSTAALRALLPGGQAAGSSSCGQPCGWGPMPPAT